jgi:hypothetical protein
MKTTKGRWTLIVAALAVIAATSWIVVPLASGETERELQATCVPQVKANPAHQLEMNTVSSATLVKTVVMEKEVFLCRTDRGRVVRDLEIFIEIIEDRLEIDYETVDRRIAVAICDKPIENPAEVTCSSRDVKLSAEPVDLGGCSSPRPGDQPRDPVEMNSVSAPPLVKTIKVDKEVFSCGNGIAEVYVFTEIVEARKPPDASPPGFLPVSTKFDGIVCLKNLSKEEPIVECRIIAPA